MLKQIVVENWDTHDFYFFELRPSVVENNEAFGFKLVTLNNGAVYLKAVSPEEAESIAVQWT